MGEPIVRIYRLLVRFEGQHIPSVADAWVTERAYSAADAITQTLLKQRVAWPQALILEVEPYESPDSAGATPGE